MSQSRPVSSAAAAWVGVVVVGAVHDRAGSVPGVVATGAVPDETGLLDASAVAVVEVGDESVDGVDDVEALDPPAMLEQAASATVATTTNARRGAENKRERR